MISGKDIYIVYSGKDHDIEDQKGWIANFQRYLNVLLTRLAGAPIDTVAIEESKLDIERIYDPALLLIPVVSPGLLRSAHFKEELRKFQEKAINKEENNISWQLRIFKIVQYPLQEHYLLDFLHNSANYNFYHVDGFTDEVIHYDEFAGPKSEKTFWLRLYDLAFDIHRVIEKIGNADEEIERINRDINTPVVYLAEVGEDMVGIRDSLKRELQRNGYKVVPDATIPDDLELATRTINRALKTSIMTVHIIGADYGQAREADFSVPELQNKLAADYVQSLGEDETGQRDHCGRVIWIAPEMGNINVKQRLFIDRLRSDHQMLQNTELLETGVEELKTHITEKLSAKISSGGTQGSAGDSGAKIIYLICDKESLDECVDIKHYLERNGHQVLLSDFEGTLNEIRDRHNRHLRICDATIIYGRNKGDDWVKSKYKDLLKALGLGRSKPISPQAILVENEQKIEDYLGLADNALVLHNSGSVTDEVMKPFLNQLNQD